MSKKKNPNPDQNIPRIKHQSIQKKKKRKTPSNIDLRKKEEEEIYVNNGPNKIKLFIYISKHSHFLAQKPKFLITNHIKSNKKQEKTLGERPNSHHYKAKTNHPKKNKSKTSLENQSKKHERQTKRLTQPKVDENAKGFEIQA